MGVAYGLVIGATIGAILDKVAVGTGLGIIIGAVYDLIIKSDDDKD